jgi:phosphopantothenoylcysteine decarboxylase
MSHVLLGVTGSVAAVKTPGLASALREAGCEVKIVVTEPALAFFDAAALDGGGSSSPAGDGGQLSNARTLYRDADEWPAGRLFQVGEPVLHIELRRWADLLLIAPLDANTLAKLALGLSDNLLTSVYRAWDPARPVVLAPAMNTLMWEGPPTPRHLKQLLEDHGGRPVPVSQDPDDLCRAVNDLCPRLRIVPPQSKRLACGDEGMGGMAAVADIVAMVRAVLDTETRRHGD